MYEFVVYTCVAECVLMDFEPPAVFASYDLCKEASVGTLKEVVDAVFAQYQIQGDWEFISFSECFLIEEPQEPEQKRWF